LNSLENKENLVNPRLVHKLTIQTPDPFLVEQYLKEIAKMYNIKLSGQLSDPLLVSLKWHILKYLSNII
jgi:vacuolar protein sorting-associated protein IST1